MVKLYLEDCGRIPFSNKDRSFRESHQHLQSPVDARRMGMQVTEGQSFKGKSKQVDLRKGKVRRGSTDSR